MTFKTLKAELSALQTPAPRAAKRRPPEDVVRRYNQSGYSDPKIMFMIPLAPITGSDEWYCLPVCSIGAESFEIISRYGRPVFREDELKPDADGKIIINIETLACGGYSNAWTSQEFEFPIEILEKRKEARRLEALAKDAVFIDSLLDPRRYFYIENGKLRILQGNKETVADQIEIIYGRKAVNVETLECGHQFLELPEEVAQKFEKVLLEKALKSLALVPAGVSLLNGCDYYRLNMDIPESMFDQVKDSFTWFGDVGEMSGWLTCYPGNVAKTLGIGIID